MIEICSLEIIYLVLQKQFLGAGKNLFLGADVIPAPSFRN